MIDNRPPITPQSKVGDILSAYPELEETLIAIAPAFKKLRNPLLRRTVARVTSLAQAARVGNVSVAELVQRLRAAVGQPEFVGETEETGLTVLSEVPSHIDLAKVVETIDARPMIEAGEQPMTLVLKAINKLEGEALLLLITPFEPAPLRDRARERGFQSVAVRHSAGVVTTYFWRERPLSTLSEPQDSSLR